jgi:hypothetical protein
MDGTCSSHAEGEKCVQNLPETLKTRDRLGDVGADGKIILRCAVKLQDRV